MEINVKFYNRFKEILKDEKDFKNFIESNKKPLNKSFRINSLKVSQPEKVVESIKNKGFKIREVPWNKNSYFVEYDENFRYDLGNLYEHFTGEIYVQEATSMIPALVLELEFLKEKSKILDMAAAPGSKTTQIVELTKDKCIVVANELDYRRISPLKINLERLGAKNVIINNQDGRFIDTEYKFDRILLDAPCSGSGIIRKSPKTMKFYNPKKLKRIVDLQKSLFRNSINFLKPKGILVYSTCSLEPEENELLVEWALKKFKDIIELEKIDLKGLKYRRGVEEIEGIKISKEVQEKVMRVWPQDNDTGGFFVAKFRKK